MANDELEEINGLKPKVWLEDGEEQEVSSLTSNSVYKVKRTFDHYYCTCPAWRNQGGCPVNARTCKHLKSLLGDKYEDARVKMKNPDGPPPKGGAKAKPASKAKAKATPKKTSKRAVDDDDNDEEEKKKPRSRKASSKPESKAKAKPVSKTSSKRKRAAADDDDEEDDDDDDDDDDEEDEEERPAKRSRKTPAPSSSKGKAKAKDDEDDDDQDDNDDDEDVEMASKSVPELLLANKWDLEKGPDPTGWWISEKLDGVRTYYDGKQFISRLGNPFTPPNWFLDSSHLNPFCQIT